MFFSPRHWSHQVIFDLMILNLMITLNYICSKLSTLIFLVYSGNKLTRNCRVCDGSSVISPIARRFVNKLGIGIVSIVIVQVQVN